MWDELSADTKAIIELAARNSWNAAINECCKHLPVECSIRLRGLYKIEPPALSPAGREAGSTEDVGGKL